MHRLDDAFVLDQFPAAPIDYDNIAQYRGLLERRLLINRCTDCGRWSQPPRGVCPSCWSDSVVPAQISGAGTIHLLTSLHQGPMVDGVAYAPTYPVAVVELAEQVGLRFTATLVDPEGRLMIGSTVQLTWIERAGVAVPAFRASE